MTMVEKLREAVAQGELTAAQAEQVIGYQLLTAGAERTPGYSRPTRWRRRQLIQQSGFVLAGEHQEEVDFDLSDVMDQVVGTDLWEREG